MRVMAIVLAKLAIEDGKQVSVINMFNPENLKGDAATAYQRFINNKLTPANFRSTSFDGVDVIVDALFGTGLIAI